MHKVRLGAFNLLLDYPQYAKKVISRMLASLGDQVGWIALIWLVYHISGNPSSIGIVTLLYQVPQAIIRPFAGLVLDRYPRARMMALTNIVVGILFIFIPLFASNDHVIAIDIITLMIGMFLPFDTTGVEALTTELIPKDKLLQANFIGQSEWHVAYLLGPALGGILISILGSSCLLYADAGTFFLTAILLGTIKSKNPRLKQKRSSSIGTEFFSGLAYLRKRPALISLAFLTFMFNFFYGPYEVVLPYVSKALFSGPTSLGLLWTLFAIGAASGSFVFSLKPWRFSTAKSLLVIIILWGMITLGFAYASSLLLASICTVIAGLIFSPWDALVATARQNLVTLELQARVYGVTSSITMLGMPLGAWITGLLLPDYGTKMVMTIASVATIGLGLQGFTWSTFRQLDG
ncbi:MFS transporter [Alicyclobacillus acidoterrestris]|uniref:MFS transporter n=1 Tax=Alicyclobacillus acidoterrestris (strain ATCC 49025 / DSM 3922 / CIP 106132 / NCIMB 13137 / GD3B) TaxID=1356854 RepID=T0BPC3_ALIAG|nr:MFS transporter [Alicyclobacillus acidoterrestris]EPZ42579.1 hypothetical protein N007_14740 [Alicyclobacillus acidoterrestris ATCC 49025]UNO49103.1 MFS transporter [Alicyclobacillus acidoterrestris]